MATTFSNIISRNVEPTSSWLGPPLRTLRQPAFDTACAELMRLVETQYVPTLVVGVRTGGLIVAQSMVRAASSVTRMRAARDDLATHVAITSASA